MARQCLSDAGQTADILGRRPGGTARREYVGDHRKAVKKRQEIAAAAKPPPLNDFDPFLNICTL